MREYDANRIRARSVFEAVGSPRNGGNRRPRPNTALELQALMTTTLERGEEKPNQHPRGANAKTEGICCHHAHATGKSSSKKENQANLQWFCEMMLLE